MNTPNAGAGSARTKRARWLAGATVVAVALEMAGCGTHQRLPRDPNLETFIEVSSRCVFVDRAFSKESDLFKEELAEVEFPAGWQQMVDSLLAAHGTSPAFWYDVYTQIVERSRR